MIPFSGDSVACYLSTAATGLLHLRNQCMFHGVLNLIHGSRELVLAEGALCLHIGRWPCRRCGGCSGSG